MVRLAVHAVPRTVYIVILSGCSCAVADSDNIPAMRAAISCTGNDTNRESCIFAHTVEEDGISLTDCCSCAQRIVSGVFFQRIVIVYMVADVVMDCSDFLIVGLAV